MASPAVQVDAVCLDVAIDHRLMRLLKPVVTPAATRTSSHLGTIHARGEELGCSAAEIDVTKNLAGPGTPGGITVALQQPRPQHPFDEGVDAVIKDCNTLAALDELFLAASCGTLSIRTNVSVIDLMQYIPESTMNDMTDNELREACAVTRDVFCQKEPDVVLCAGRLSFPRWRKYDGRKGEVFKLERIGVGKTFGPVSRVKLARQGRGFVSFHKINGFHPSYCVNRRPQDSSLRQLQLLAVAETCWAYAKLHNPAISWKEAPWMQDLRDTCARVATDASSPSPRRTTRQSSTSSASSSRSLYLPDYEELYSDKLLDIQNAITSLSRPAALQRTADDDVASVYQSLLDSQLSQMCNDASLLLREMRRLERKGWESRSETRNTDALRDVARGARDFIQRMRKLPFATYDRRLGDVICDTIIALFKSLSSDQTNITLTKAADAFLNLAVGVEKLLSDLLEQDEAASRETAPAQSEAVDTKFILAMGAMSMTSAKVPTQEARVLRRGQVAGAVRA